MARSYAHLQEQEEKILELKAKGLTNKEIGLIVGFSKSQIKAFIYRYNKKQKELSVGITRINGRPPVDCPTNENDTIRQLKNAIERKDSKIKRLEMEKKLITDFLLLTEGM